jgi:SH3-like domain-containing protein
VSDVAVARKELHLSEALPFAIAEDAPATVASRSVATVVVRFAARVAIRRAPRRDSRVFAYTRPESEAEALRIEREWLKIQTSTPVEGWVLASEAAIREGEVVAEASFRRAVPVRSAPFPGESLVRWEGRVVRKEAASGASGATRHLLHCQDLRGEKRTLEVPRATWDSFIETDYLIEREGMGVGKYGPPVAFTRIGPPYEVLERQDEWVRIQVQDQGWVARADGELDVRYHYSISRRQALSRWIGRLAGARWLRGRYEAFLLDRRR